MPYILLATILCVLLHLGWRWWSLPPDR